LVKVVKMKIREIGILCCLLIALTVTSLAQTSWVETSGIAPIDNITPQQARQQALKSARQLAIEQVCGIKIQAETMVKEQILAGDFIHAISNGEIIGEEILKEEVLIEQADSRLAPNLTYKVSIKAKVRKMAGDPDPNFRIDLQLNRTAFQDGDELVISVKSSMDCYINVINITADDQAILLFPNKFSKDNAVKAGATFQIPSEQSKASGIALKVGRIPGHKTDSEIIKVIATNTPLDMYSLLSLSGDFGEMGTVQTALKDLIMTISRVPMYQRAEAGAMYEISGP